MARTISGGDPDALPPPRWFGLSLTGFLTLAAGATVVLIILGAFPPVLGALVGGAFPAFRIRRARFIRIPFLLTFLGGFIGAAVAGVVWTTGSLLDRAVLSVAAGAVVGLALAVSGIALWLRDRTRGASA